MTTSEAHLLIEGRESGGESAVELREPYRGTVNLRVQIASAEQVDRAVESAAAAFRDFGRQPMHARAAILAKVAKEVAASKAAFVEALIEASGKTRKDASGEVDRS